MSIINISKKVPWSKLADFMGKWKGKKFKDMFPMLHTVVIDTWRKEIMTMFTEWKEGLTFGEIPDSEMDRFITQIATPIKYMGYASENYVKWKPNTYVKTGDLAGEMAGLTPYSFSGWVDYIGEIFIEIPLNTHPREDPLAYQWLEAKRSLVRGAFLRAWPQIIQAIIGEILNVL